MIHSTVRDEVERPVFEGFRDINESYISSKARTLDSYMWMLEPYFDRFEIYSGEGERRQPYPYQWIAYSKVFEGSDDAYEGVGGSPFEAIRNLYNNIKRSVNNPDSENEA
jgi:hypothetical protein